MNKDNILIEERQLITEFAEDAYFQYAMYVIMDRALPRISDGLKPVQRRIIYAMSELGLSSSAKFKKSARTVGDVLGKFHPHGDSACYEAMVHLAQPFSIRYPLIDGQGNWGSQDDPKSFAAMRYTESRMTKYASILLSELSLGTVDWVPNFDGTLKEPSVLPARLPNILLNGSSGIAVGMSTDIPSHNLKEVADAVIAVIDNPEISLEEIMGIIKGPDFACGGEIVSPEEDILKIYKTGTGTIRVRGTYEVEKGEVVIKSIPPYVSASKIIEDIASQISAKKLPMVTDLRDESDHEEPLRIVISLKSGKTDAESLMSHLFATTDLEKSTRINFNYIGNNNKPKVTGILELLKEWIEFRKDTTIRRLKSRLEKINERLHILDGLRIAFLNLDEIIRIVRYEEEPKKELMTKFNLSEIQADAILNTRLRSLAKLEEEKILTEYDELKREKNFIEERLNDGNLLMALIKEEIEEIRDEFKDERRTNIAAKKQPKALSVSKLITPEPVTVILSDKNWIRAGKGHEIDPASLSYKSGDKFLFASYTKNTYKTVFMDNEGKAYSIESHNLPSARSYGEPLSSKLHLLDTIKIKAMISDKEDAKYIFATTSGYGFISKISSLYSKNKKGKNFLTVPEKASPLFPLKIENPDKDLLVAVTLEGRVLIFKISELPELERGKGNQIIRIIKKDFEEKKDKLVLLHILPEECSLILYSGARKLNITHSMIKDFIGKRGQRGKILPRGFRKVKKLENKFPKAIIEE